MLRFKRIKHAGNSVPGCVGGPVLRVGLQAGGQAEAKSYKYFPQLGSSSRPQGLQSKTLQSALPRGGGEKNQSTSVSPAKASPYVKQTPLLLPPLKTPNPHSPPPSQPPRRENYNSQESTPERTTNPSNPCGDFFFKVGALVCYWLFLRGRGRRRPVAVIGRKFLLLKIPEQPAEPAQFSVQGVVRHRAR